MIEISTLLIAAIAITAVQSLFYRKRPHFGYIIWGVWQVVMVTFTMKISRYIIEHVRWMP